MQKEKNVADGSKLRRLAEKALETMTGDPDDLSGMTHEEMVGLIHELRVHQIELNMQTDELRRIQGELEKIRNRYSHLYDFAPVGYLSVSENGTVEQANLTAATLLRSERARLVGQPFSRFILHEDQDIFYLHRKRLLETEQPQSFRLRLVKQDGSEFYAHLECMIIEEGEDDLRQIRTVISDVTEQKELENQLRQAQKLEAVGTLAGGIAHDFNNILSGVIGFAELALIDAPKGTNLADYLKEVLMGGKRAKLLVQQILSFSRQAPQKLLPLRLDTLAEESARLLRSTIPADIEIAVEIKSAADPYVMGDESQIHQVILNLCTNAAYAMETDGGKLTIGIDDIILDNTKAGNVAGLLPGKYVRLSVSDNGSGMTPEIAERIFDPYYSTKAPDRGTGMGLAVVEGIVKTHNGHIVVLSQPQKGSTFTVFLPMLEKLESKPDSMLQEELPGGAEHILFVDDELQIAKVNKMMLEALGYRVTTTTSSLEALASFRAAPGRFDIVITDMSMPNLAGDKLAAELMEIRPDIPVVLCTGFSRKISSETADGIGIKAFAYKPYTMAELAKTVRKVLDEAKGSTHD